MDLEKGHSLYLIDLLYIIGKDYANGKAARGPGNVVMDLEKEDEDGLHDDENEMEDINITQSINQTASRKRVDLTCCSRKKASVDDWLANNISKFRKDMVEAIQQATSKLVDVRESVNCQRFLWRL